MGKRLGLISRGDSTGLSVQTYGLYEHLKPHRTLVVDFSRFSGIKPDPNMYPDGTIWNEGVYPSLDPVSDDVLEDFLQNVDVVLTCETPYNYWLFKRARELGVKTFLMFNYEFLDYSRNDGIPEPDVFLAVSQWHIEDVYEQLPGREIVNLPVPVDRNRFKFQHRDSLKTLLHTAGTVSMEDRNGTLIATAAMPFVKSPVRLMVRSQRVIRGIKKNSKIKFILGRTKRAERLYGDQSAYLIPRKFGGLCLPINEALSVGMPTLVTDCDPQNRWVPDILRIKASRTKEVQTRNPIYLYECDPSDVAEKIDYLYSNPSVFSDLSTWANDHAEVNSWSALLKTYFEVLYD